MTNGYVSAFNNGVYVVMHIGDYKRLSNECLAVPEALNVGIKFFTFVSPESYLPSPNTYYPFEYIFYTGSWYHMDVALAGVQYHGERSIYVPFSNGYEHGSLNERERQREYCCITTVNELAKTFGIPPWTQARENSHIITYSTSCTVEEEKIKFRQSAWKHIFKAS